MHQIRKFVARTVVKQHRHQCRPSLQRNLIKSMSTTDTFELPPEIVDSQKKKLSQSIPEGVLGQATCHTHPHLIKEGHLTCGVTQAEYAARREKLVGKLTEEVNAHKTHIIVIPAARKQYISEKIPYVFRQHSDFFYLTGCLEACAVLVIVKPAQIDAYKSILFVHEKDDHAELWEGPRTGCSTAPLLFGVDEARPINEFGTFLHETAAASKPVTLWYHNESPANLDIHNTIRATLKGDGLVTLSDPQRALHLMRVVKSPAEVELMKETCHVGSQAMNIAMSYTKPGVSEHMINAILEYSSKQGGAEHLAFPPVVAGGSRATHIHYVSNNQLLRDGDMLLVDSGCQRWLYNSDISRTWPVSGKFSKHQRILYELVLSVQKRLIEILSEHRPPLDHLFDSMCRLLGMHLQQEGILPKNIDGHELIGKAYRLCPHHVSHYLGLDVHDSSLVRRNVPVCDNMVVTVEPGIYIRSDDTSVPIEFRGIGVRIEDDILITAGEPLVLTSSCVKEVADIENIVGKNTL